MSTPAGQLLSVEDLKQLYTLMKMHKHLKTGIIKSEQFKHITAESIQFKQLIKQKIKADMKHSSLNEIIRCKLTAANDDNFQRNHTKQTTYLID